MGQRRYSQLSLWLCSRKWSPACSCSFPKLCLLTPFRALNRARNDSPKATGQNKKHEWSLTDDSWAAASLKSHLDLGTQAASLEDSAHLLPRESLLPSNCFYSHGEQVEAFPILSSTRVAPIQRKSLHNNMRSSRIFFSKWVAFKMVTTLLAWALGEYEEQNSWWPGRVLEYKRDTDGSYF